MKKLCIVLLLQLLCFANDGFAQDVAEVCPFCKGYGTQKCALCDGKGHWKAEIDGKKKKVDCPSCNGTEMQPCWLCNGTGNDVVIKSANISSTHPEGFRWLGCNSCKFHGVVRCIKCSGRGSIYAANGEASTCSLCDGKRYTLCASCHGSCGWYVEQVRCSVCEGGGAIICGQCHGQGWLPPEHIEKPFAEVCKKCKGVGLVLHIECEGKGCRKCKEGKVKCLQCEGHGAVVISPEPEYKDCSRCHHKGVLRCNVCDGRGYKNLTMEGIERQ